MKNITFNIITTYCIETIDRPRTNLQSSALSKSDLSSTDSSKAQLMAVHGRIMPNGQVSLNKIIKQSFQVWMLFDKLGCAAKFDLYKGKPKDKMHLNLEDHKV